MISGLSLDEAAKLHGHKGPWLVLGYKAGLRANEVLKPNTEHDLFCRAYTPLKTPYTCALDGIQASTRCTLGKLSIEVVKSEVNEIKFVFLDKRTGRKLEVKLKEGVASLIEEMISKRGLSEAAKAIEDEEICELFEEKLYD